MYAHQERLEAYYFWKGAYELRHFGLIEAREKAKESPTAIGYGRSYTEADQDALYAEKLFVRLINGETLASVSYMSQYENVFYAGHESVYDTDDSIRLTINLKGDTKSILEEVRAYVEFYKRHDSAVSGYDDTFYAMLDKAEEVRASSGILFRSGSQNIRVVGLWLYDKLDAEEVFSSFRQAVEALDALTISGKNVLEALGMPCPADEDHLKKALTFTRKCIQENKVLPLTKTTKKGKQI